VLKGWGDRIGHFYCSTAQVKDLVFLNAEVISMDMQSIWTRIEKWLGENAPHILNTLQPGANEAEISELEARLSICFPEDVRASYLIHNGQSDDGEGFLYGYELLPLEFICRAWEINQEINHNQQIRENVYAQTLGEVRENIFQEDYLNSLWIPLATDISGDHYCLDLSPDPKGILGQMIRLDYEQDVYPVLAPSFHVWMEQFADALESGEYVFSEEYGVISAEELAEYESDDEF
jgi:cell wall assembly regulator SMI1